MSSELSVLESFVIDNAELEVLESVLAPFNVFEAIGVTTQELRHSTFLAYLLDPSRNHGLGDGFARSFLVAALRAVPPQDRPLSLVDVEVAGLDDLEVRREWQHIDILLLSRRLDLAVVIENKVYSGEHDNQLARYMFEVTSRNMASKVVGVFLTRDGAIASDPMFAALSYAVICNIIERMVERQAGSLGMEVRGILSHYVQMLRRHILEDSQVAELARAIYRKHRAALDIIFEHRPDLQLTIQSWLEDHIRNDDGLVLETSTKRYIRFSPREWDDYVPKLGQNWVASSRVLVFEFQNESSGLSLKLIIGPGDQRLREELFSWALTHEPFKPARRRLQANWNQIWAYEVLRREEIEAEPEEALIVLERRWSEIVGTAIPLLTESVRRFRPTRG